MLKKKIKNKVAIFSNEITVVFLVLDIDIEVRPNINLQIQRFIL